nr:ABC transporter ATP-binding protein [Gemmatimonadota bacterium]
AIARALLHRPELVFLDEPTAGLDPVAAVSLRADIVALAEREGLTVFVTTHNLAEAEKICGRVGVVRAGRLMAVGTPAELRARAGDPYVDVAGRRFGPDLVHALLASPNVADARLEDGGLRIDLRGDVPAAPIVRLIVELGGEVEEVRRSRASLEDAFITLVEAER